MPTTPEQGDFLPTSPTPLRWRSWPARESLWRTAVVTLALLSAGLFVRWSTGEPYLAWFAAAALAISLWRFFVPTDYELSAGGVDQWTLGRRRHLAWKAICRYKLCNAGVLLLPQEDDCPMDVFRSLYLPWSDCREAVLLRLRQQLGEPSS